MYAVILLSKFDVLTEPNNRARGKEIHPRSLLQLLNELGNRRMLIMHGPSGASKPVLIVANAQASR